MVCLHSRVSSSYQLGLWRQENCLVQDAFSCDYLIILLRILLIGGNGFIGRFAVATLKQQGHALAAFHRGTTAVPAGVDEIRGDRNQLKAGAQELKHFAPDVVIDLVISSAPQAEELMNIFRGGTRRVVMLSSIDVYRAVGISHGTESGPLQEVPLTEESELRRNLHP